MDCIPTPQHQPSPAPLPEMERSATPQHQPSPAPSIPEMEHNGTDPLRHQPSPAPSIPVERSATPPRQSISPQPPHIVSPQRQPIPPAPPVMDRRQTRQSKSNRPPPRHRSPPKKKPKEVKPQKSPPVLPFEIPGFWIPIRRDYFDNGTGDLWIANEELFQLFHQLALDKSIVSLYCL